MRNLVDALGWFWMPVPWLWRGCWDWDAMKAAWGLGFRTLGGR